jgi:hypothetical protein
MHRFRCVLAVSKVRAGELAEEPVTPQLPTTNCDPVPNDTLAFALLSLCLLVVLLLTGAKRREKGLKAKQMRSIPVSQQGQRTSAHQSMKPGSTQSARNIGERSPGTTAAASGIIALAATAAEKAFRGGSGKKLRKNIAAAQGSISEKGGNQASSSSKSEAAQELPNHLMIPSHAAKPAAKAPQTSQSMQQNTNQSPPELATSRKVTGKRKASGGPPSPSRNPASKATRGSSPRKSGADVINLLPRKLAPTSPRQKSKALDKTTAKVPLQARRSPLVASTAAQIPHGESEASAPTKIPSVSPSNGSGATPATEPKKSAPVPAEETSKPSAKPTDVAKAIDTSEKNATSKANESTSTDEPEKKLASASQGSRSGPICGSRVEYVEMIEYHDAGADNVSATDEQTSVFSTNSGSIVFRTHQNKNFEPPAGKPATKLISDETPTESERKSESIAAEDSDGAQKRRSTRKRVKRMILLTDMAASKVEDLYFPKLQLGYAIVELPNEAKAGDQMLVTWPVSRDHRFPQMFLIEVPEHLPVSKGASGGKRLLKVMAPGCFEAKGKKRRLSQNRYIPRGSPGKSNRRFQSPQKIKTQSYAKKESRVGRMYQVPNRLPLPVAYQPGYPSEAVEEMPQG